MEPVKTHQGYLFGKRLDAVEIASLCRSAGWRGDDIMIATAVCLSESNGYVKARNENFLDGVHVSTDFGLFEHNYPANMITSELLQRMYDPERNVAQAFELWQRRGFQPWHGYTGHIALNPAMRGKYIQRAVWGVMNLTRRDFGMRGVPSPYIMRGRQRLTWWIEHPELKS